MKKLLKTSGVLVILALFIVLSNASCTKDSSSQPEPDPKHPIEGLWIGTYAVDGYPNLGQQYFSFIIKPDGTMINDTKGSNIQHIAIGTWSLSGNIFSCSFTCIYGISSNIGVKETCTATFDDTGKLTGTWKNVAPLTGSGSITLARVN